MANDMQVEAKLTGPMRFDIETGSGHQITLDANAQSGGNDEGARPMELLLVALAGCAGMDIISILRKKRQQVDAYAITIHGARADEQPKPFTHIIVEHHFTGQAIKPEAVQRAIDLTEQRYCGVSAMLGKSAHIEHTFTLQEREDTRSVPAS
jgi:putative redox protein